MRSWGIIFNLHLYSLQISKGAIILRIIIAQAAQVLTRVGLQTGTLKEIFQATIPALHQEAIPVITQDPAQEAPQAHRTLDLRTKIPVAKQPHKATAPPDTLVLFSKKVIIAHIGHKDPRLRLWKSVLIK